MDTKFYEHLCNEEKSLSLRSNELFDEQKKISESLNAIKVLKKLYVEPKTISSEIKTVTEDQDVEYPTKYDDSLNQMQKTFVALYDIQTGYWSDIAKKLGELYTKMNTKRVEKVARQKASQLLSAGVIGARKVGLKNKYFILK